MSIFYFPTGLIKKGAICEDIGIGIIGKDVAFGQLIWGEFFDEEGEDETDDRGHDLAAIGAGLFGL